ncbi:allophanate hydrolase, partial [Paenibacillus sepulcri]|nr:allophanate hydrolase [Paenibacillus sepulcri]
AEDYRQAWEASVMALEKLKIPVDYIDTDLFAEAAEILYGGPLVAERWASLGGFVEEYPDAIFPVTAQVLRTGAATRYTAASVFQAMHKLQRLKLAAGGLLKDAVLVMPTCGG